MLFIVARERGRAIGRIRAKGLARHNSGMDVNPLVFGSETPPADSITLRAGVFTMEFRTESGAIRYLELPDGAEAVRAVYASLRGPNWETETPCVSNLHLKEDEDSFSVSFDLDYESPYEAKVSIEGGPDGIVYSYSGVATGDINTSRTGLCILHPSSLADQPVEIRHPDGTRESGRFPDLVQPDWPFREVVGVSSKFPGYKVEIKMEGEIFEMEDQRNYGDASFKTYCRQQSRPFPYIIAVGEKVNQTVRITAKPWGSKVEALEPIPDGVAALMFLDETLPIPLIGLVGGEVPDLEALRYAPIDYLSMPALGAIDMPMPLELTLDLSEDAEARMGQAVARINALQTPPDRLIVTPISSSKYIPALKEQLGELLVMAGAGSLVELNRSGLQPKDNDGVAFGFHPQNHLFDDQTLFENLEALPDLAATAGEKTEGPIVVGPVRLGRDPDPRTNSLLFASWVVAALSSIMMSDVDAVTLFDLVGPDGLFRDGRIIPAYHVLHDLLDFSEGELVIGMATARRAAGFAIVMDDKFRAIAANLTPRPLRLSMVAAGDGPHYVKVLDEDALDRALNESAAWRKEPGYEVIPSESMIEFDLGPYAVARIDAVVDDLDADGETFPA
jgi:hypothetical protein